MSTTNRHTKTDSNHTTTTTQQQPHNNHTQQQHTTTTTHNNHTQQQPHTTTTTHNNNHNCNNVNAPHHHNHNTPYHSFNASPLFLSRTLLGSNVRLKVGFRSMLSKLIVMEKSHFNPIFPSILCQPCECGNRVYFVVGL